MRQLERILGADKLQDGLRDYLKRIPVRQCDVARPGQGLDDRTDLDLAAWSRAWVEEGGTALIRTELECAASARCVQADPSRTIAALDPADADRARIGISGVRIRSARNSRRTSGDSDFAAQPKPVCSADGRRSRLRRLHARRRQSRVSAAALARAERSRTRGAAWVTLWEELLGRRVRPPDFIDLALRALPQEDTEQNVAADPWLTSARLLELYPRDQQRLVLAPRLEQAFRAGWRARRARV